MNLTRDHITVLRSAERGETPDITRTKWVLALDECRRWELVRPKTCSLTPQGAKALSEFRSNRRRS